MGLQRESAATATLATTTQIVWTYIFELAFLHEEINGWSLAGTGLILGFMLYVGYVKMVRTEQQAQQHQTAVASGNSEESALLPAAGKSGEDASSKV